MEKFYINVERGRREEFYRTLKNYLSDYYGEVEFSDTCISASNFKLSDFTLDGFRCNIRCFKIRKRTLLTIEEFDDHIVVTTNTKSSLMILNKFLKSLKS